MLGPWKLLSRLGEGSMAEVWLGENSTHGRAAVKWMRPDGPRGRFLDEAEVVADLNHPHIVHFLGEGESDGRPWYAMEYIAGLDLAALGEKLRARPVAERHARVRDVATQLAGALGYLHDRGLVHRDLKPANVLWDGRAILADFGVACVVGSAPETGFVGSLAWAAPEQITGSRADPRADQFGLGLVLYWLLTGRRPWGESGRLRSTSTRPPPPSAIDPTVPADLEAVIERMLAGPPAQRFPSMAAVEAAVRNVGEGDAPILAGRQRYADQLAAELDRVAGGESRTVMLIGAPGAGQEWLSRLAVSGAARRGLVCIASDDPSELRLARDRAEAGEPLLVVTTVATPGAQEVVLQPLGLGDVRRSVFSVAPRTPELAQASERLLALTGGHAALLERVFEVAVHGGALALPTELAVDVGVFLDELDLDALDVAQALAALSEPATVNGVAAVAANAHSDTRALLATLERAGIAEGIGGHFRLAAELFRAPLLARAVDADALLARARSASESAAQSDSVLAAARAAIDAGQHQEALLALIAAVDLEASTLAISHERRLLLAVLLWYLHDADGAFAQWSRVQTESHDARHRARAGIGLGVIAMQAGDIERALDHLEAALVDADIVHDGRSVALACIDLAEARGLHGEPARALRAARRARDEARVLRDRSLEAKAGRALGQVYVDLGLPAEAEAALADAAALARAASVEEERMAAQILRARAALDARPGDATAGAVALDRVVPFSRNHAANADPESIRPLVQAVAARAHAALGQAEQARGAADRALALGAQAPRAMRLRTGIEVVRAWIALGRGPEALGLAESIAAEAQVGTMRLLAWEAASLAARIAGLPLPALSVDLVGLSPAERAAIEARFGRG